jgi:prolipoprotein diacylglyceryl transferase
VPAPSSIPSPASSSLELGPLEINAYGLMIALGLLAATWLFGRRLEQRGIGTRDDAGAIALWAGLAGVVGARLYHVATDWDRFSGNLGEIPQIWEGGLGIPGALVTGVPAGLWVARRRGMPLGVVANCAAPTIALGQAIGRWGNYFNQELFGEPTDLPWALEIDADHLPAGYEPGTTFHPTFLYESLWSFALVGVLLLIDRRFRPAPWRLFAMYVVGYGLGRFWVEGLRIDEADELGGLRWNQWVALAAIVGGLAFLLFAPRRTAIAPSDDAPVEPGDGADDADADELIEEDEAATAADETGPDDVSPEAAPQSPDRTDAAATDPVPDGSDRPASTS